MSALSARSASSPKARGTPKGDWMGAVSERALGPKPPKGSRLNRVRRQACFQPKRKPGNTELKLSAEWLGPHLGLAQGRLGKIFDPAIENWGWRLSLVSFHQDNPEFRSGAMSRKEGPPKREALCNRSGLRRC